MNEKLNGKFSFYLQHKNVLFDGNILTICYKADKKEIKKYGLTGENILILIKNRKINELLNKKNTDYLLELKKLFDQEEIFLRVQCECLLGIYGDSHCDCEEQRIKSINIIKEKDGIFIHLPQEGQGWGLHYKLNELELQVSGRTPNGEFLGVKNRDDAQKILVGNKEFEDFRGYDIISQILTFLKLQKKKIVLITESEKKIQALKKNKLDAIKYTDYQNSTINTENLSEYLIKILNSTHDFDEKIIEKIIELIEERKYNGRSLSTLTNIVDKINNDKNYILSTNLKKKLLEAYDKIICGIEKKYIIGDTNIIKIQNNFSCKVNSSIFKAIKNLYGNNIFDRVSLEKLYYFENKIKNEHIRVRTSRILDVIDTGSIFLKGQMHAEQRTFDENKTQIIQNEISLSKLRSFFENDDYDYVKRVEMITVISEKQIPGLNIYIKKLPNIENRIIDIFGKKEDIQNFLNSLISNLNRNVLNDIVSNAAYEDENFTEYNLRFADLESAINEELEIYKLLKKEDVSVHELMQRGDD